MNWPLKCLIVWHYFQFDHNELMMLKWQSTTDYGSNLKSKLDRSAARLFRRDPFESELLLLLLLLSLLLLSLLSLASKVVAIANGAITWRIEVGNTLLGLGLADFSNTYMSILWEVCGHNRLLRAQERERERESERERERERERETHTHTERETDRQTDR